ncbi:MAG TPA: site-specific DNA-methyltransferase [Sedimentisphaerales bacterium]|nr:site-specific DNA-methyltransferase [Sedimentisphaerales bacterium]
MTDLIIKDGIPEIESSYSSEAKVVLYEGDCLDAIPEIPSGSVQLVVTSPPYNVGKAYERTTRLERYLQAQEPILRELVRVLSFKGSMCWQIGNYVEHGEVFPLDMYYYPIFKKLGLHLRNRIIWYFNHGLHASKRFSGRYEVVLWFTKSNTYTFNLDGVRIPSKYPGKRHFKGAKKGQPSCNPLGKNPSDIWQVVAQDWEKELWNIPNVKANHPEKTIHPCQFPIELVQRCVLALTNADDWVLDPFAGVGSALIAALMHNRRAMGCEKDSGYVETAKSRIRGYYDGTLRVRPLGKPVHKPSGRERVSQRPPEWGNQNRKEVLFE